MIKQIDIMTQEEIELFLKEICRRLPYGVVIKDRNEVNVLTSRDTKIIDLFDGKYNLIFSKYILYIIKNN